MRVAAALLTLAALSGCDLLNDTDPREGNESAADCAARVANLLGPTTSYRRFSGEAGTPTFTYDITKMSLEDIQGLIVTGSDETAGSRGMVSTNETSTAVAQFMAQSVDENGSFFMGRDPALYRVRSAAEELESMIATGCARQQTGMRLIMIDVSAGQPDDAEPDDTSTPEENNS